jgi:hypothetical protein
VFIQTTEPAFKKKVRRGGPAADKTSGSVSKPCISIPSKVPTPKVTLPDILIPRPPKTAGVFLKHSLRKATSPPPTTQRHLQSSALQSNDSVSSSLHHRERTSCSPVNNNENSPPAGWTCPRLSGSACRSTSRALQKVGSASSACIAAARRSSHQCPKAHVHDTQSADASLPGGFSSQSHASAPDLSAVPVEMHQRPKGHQVDVTHSAQPGSIQSTPSKSPSVSFAQSSASSPSRRSAVGRHVDSSSPPCCAHLSIHPATSLPAPPRPNSAFSRHSPLSIQHSLFRAQDSPEVRIPNENTLTTEPVTPHRTLLPATVLTPQGSPSHSCTIQAFSLGVESLQTRCESTPLYPQPHVYGAARRPPRPPTRLPSVPLCKRTSSRSVATRRISLHNPPPAKAGKYRLHPGPDRPHGSPVQHFPPQLVPRVPQFVNEHKDAAETCQENRWCREKDAGHLATAEGSHGGSKVLSDAGCVHGWAESHATTELRERYGKLVQAANGAAEAAGPSRQSSEDKGCEGWEHAVHTTTEFFPLGTSAGGDQVHAPAHQADKGSCDLANHTHASHTHTATLTQASPNADRMRSPAIKQALQALHNTVKAIPAASPRSPAERGGRGEAFKDRQPSRTTSSSPQTGPCLGEGTASQQFKGSLIHQHPSADRPRAQRAVGQPPSHPQNMLVQTKNVSHLGASHNSFYPLVRSTTPHAPPELPPVCDGAAPPSRTPDHPTARKGTCEKHQALLKSPDQAAAAAAEPCKPGGSQQHACAADERLGRSNSASDSLPSATWISQAKSSTCGSAVARESRAGCRPPTSGKIQDTAHPPVSCVAMTRAALQRFQEPGQSSGKRCNVEPGRCFSKECGQHWDTACALPSGETSRMEDVCTEQVGQAVIGAIAQDADAPNAPSMDLSIEEAFHLLGVPPSLCSADHWLPDTSYDAGETCMPGPSHESAQPPINATENCLPMKDCIYHSHERRDSSASLENGDKARGACMSHLLHIQAIHTIVKHRCVTCCRHDITLL